MARRAGMTLMEVLVIVSLVLILIGMVMPAVSSREPMHRAACGNNLRQIAMAMMVYANENQDAWPVRYSDASGAFVPVPGHDKYTTIGTFEFLAGRRLWRQEITWRR